MLCPSNPLKGQEKLNDLVTAAGTANPPSWVPDKTRIAAGLCSNLYSSVDGSSTGWGAANVSTPTIGDWVQRHFVDKGFNSNYDASWFLVRSSVRIATARAPNDTAALPMAPFTPDGVNPKIADGQKGLAWTVGPLTRRCLESSWVNESIIPLLADASLSDPTDAILPVDVAKSPATGQYMDPVTNAKADATDPTTVVTAQAGQNTAESFQDGPASGGVGNAKIQLLSIENCTDLTLEAKCEKLGTCPPPDGSTYFLQDTRDFGCVHGAGKALSCNILMADGSVTEFNDTNGDHYLNPGSTVTAVPPGGGPGTPVADPTVNGYSDNTINLPAAQCFSGVFLSNGVNAKPRSFYNANLSVPVPSPPINPLPPPHPLPPPGLLR
jgi:prepilin-type processing-associated H-X9-DG protein